MEKSCSFASALPARGASPDHGGRFDQVTFASALPARGASWSSCRGPRWCSALPRRCLHGVHLFDPSHPRQNQALPRRCLHGVHPTYTLDWMLKSSFASALPARGASNPLGAVLYAGGLCLGAACTGCIKHLKQLALFQALFASALPARGASVVSDCGRSIAVLCLGAACTGCIGKSRQIAAHLFVAYAVSR